MGTVRLGNHELLIRLAAGGAANVFLVRDLEHENRLLALKILLPTLAQNEDFLNMFFTEAKIASHLRHPNIVTIAGFGQVDGIHCLAMEYVFGASLSQVLRASARAKKPLTVGVLLRLTASVCDALHYAHELTDENGESMGLVHRDVTPQNILIGFNGVPKLTDFGIAKATNRGWETQAGIVKGKFSYMSPEQALGKTVDRRSDIFGAGIVLWEALTGRDLFKGSTPMEVLAAIREHKIEPPSKVVPGLTPIVDPIVMKALRRSPKQRYATAAEMRDDIEELIHRAGVQIDAEAISHEFAQIYGDEIGKRALALKQAILGAVDLGGLASALGGTVLNPKQLPTMQGGVNDPDPLGLFVGSVTDAKSDEVSGSMPARMEHSFAEGPAEAAEAESFDEDDEDDDLLDMQEGAEHFVEDADIPNVPGHRLVSGWDDSTSTRIPEDELLSMISAEDATVGFLPPQFAERFALQIALAERPDDEFDDDHTVGLPEVQLAHLRAISNDESVTGIDPPMLRPLAAQLASGPETNGERPVPRAPSVLMEEREVFSKDEPRAPSWDMESPSSDRRGLSAGGRFSSRSPWGSSPARVASLQGSNAVVLRDEYPVVDKPQGRNGHRPPPQPLELDATDSKTDRAAVPLPFGAYSYTQATRKAWSGNQEPSPSPDEAPKVEPPRPISLSRTPPPLPTPASTAPVDWADPSPARQLLHLNRPEPEVPSLVPPTPEPNSAHPISGGLDIASPPTRSGGTNAKPRPPVSMIPPKPPVQLSITTLLFLGVILLIAGVALGAMLGPNL